MMHTSCKYRKFLWLDDYYNNIAMDYSIIIVGSFMVKFFTHLSLKLLKPCTSQSITSYCQTVGLALATMNI